MTENCQACDLASGRSDLPGGRIYRTDHWLVEHCVGPLGVGALIVKPERHVTALAELTVPEANELGPLLRRSAQVVSDLCHPDQVYTCLWSHAGRRPVHIHFVVQPVTSALIEQYDAVGPHLQSQMFRAKTPMSVPDVISFAASARQQFAATA